MPAQARVPLGHKPDRRLRRERRVFQSKIIIDVKHKRLCSCVQFLEYPGVFPAHMNVNLRIIGLT